MMEITDLNGFLESYFLSHHCELLGNHDGVMTVQLTEELDRALMNRPFYWHYVKSTGNSGQPMKLTFITNPDRREEHGEWIHFGSPRLQQIINHLKQNETYTKLFQKVQTDINTPLYPWLICNMKISYQGKQKKDELFSMGLHLVNGTMHTDMMQRLQKTEMNMTISDYCYPISPMIKLKSGYRRIETVINDYFERQSHEWAKASLETLEEERKTLAYFYTENADHEQMEKELKEIEERYKPTIATNVINGGIVYLTEAF